MKIWVWFPWVVAVACILALVVLTGVWQHLLNQQPTPWQIGPGGHLEPAAKGYEIG